MSLQLPIFQDPKGWSHLSIISVLVSQDAVPSAYVFIMQLLGNREETLNEAGTNKSSLWTLVFDLLQGIHEKSS